MNISYPIKEFLMSRLTTLAKYSAGIYTLGFTYSTLNQLDTLRLKSYRSYHNDPEGAQKQGFQTSNQVFFHSVLQHSPDITLQSITWPYRCVTGMFPSLPKQVSSIKDTISSCLPSSSPSTASKKPSKQLMKEIKQLQEAQKLGEELIQAKKTKTN